MQGKMSNKNKKKKQERVILSSPWSMKCVSIRNEDEDIIIEQIESLVSKYPLLKNKIKSASKENSTKAILNEDAELKNKYRKELAFGINEVTRSLEKNLLVAVLISRGANPPHLTKHILPLCATRNVPVVSLKELNNKVAKLLNFSSLMAFGLKCGAEQQTSIFYDLWNVIQEKAITIPNPLKLFQINSVEESTDNVVYIDDEKKVNVNSPKFSSKSIQKIKPSNEEKCPAFLSLETNNNKLDFPVYELPKKISIQIFDFPSQSIQDKPEIKLCAAKLKRVIPSGKIKSKRKKLET